MKNIKTFVLFFVLNFAALALGGLFTGSGVTSDWYTKANQAPWTPPGFVFGLAWTLIMICFSFYMARVSHGVANSKPKTIFILYGIQWLLNVAWNPTFFYFHQVGLALVLIVLLFVSVAWFLKLGKQHSRVSFLLVLPYFVWLLIAISLNAYFLMANHS
jgi:tryptophan-rich sensory protein